MKITAYRSKLMASFLIVIYLFLYLMTFNSYLNRYKFNYITFITGYEAANNFDDFVSNFKSEDHNMVDVEFPVMENSFPLLFIVYFKKIIYEIVLYLYSTILYQSSFYCILFSFSTFFLENLENILGIDYILINQKGRDSPF